MQKQQSTLAASAEQQEGTLCTVDLSALARGVFLLTVQTHSRFISPNTHSIGADKLNVAVTLTDRAEAILTDWAKAVHKSRSQLMRELLIAGAKASGSTRAIALKAAMHIPAIGCLLLTSWIYAQPFFKGFDDSVEMRRGRVVRTSKVRDLEMEGA